MMINLAGFFIGSLLVVLGLIIYLVDFFKPFVLHYRYRKMMQQLNDEDF
jgi:uncharacterized membrane protein